MNFKRVAIAAVSLCAVIAFGITTKRVVLANEHIFEGLVTFKTNVTHSGPVTNSGTVTNSGAVTNSSTVSTTGLSTLGAVTSIGAFNHNGAFNQVGAVAFDGGAVDFATAPTIADKNIVTSHTLPDAGVAPLALEMHKLIMSSNTATYTFATPFTGIPICTCSDTTVTTPVACSANAATTTQVVLYSIGASAVVNVICVGVR